MSRKKKKKVTPVKPRKVDELKIMQIYDFNLIPPSLFEQVKDLEFDPQKLYRLNPDLRTNPFTQLFVFAHKETKKIKGFLWMRIEPLTEKLQVHTMSVEREYWTYKGDIIDMAKSGIFDKTKERYKLKSTQILTTRPDALMRKGFGRSKYVLLEDN